MNIGNDINLNNGLYLLVDWIEFTIKKIMSWEDAVSHFGLNVKEFKTELKGAQGYRSHVRHIIYPISFLYDGNDDMGIHVCVSGSAVRYFLDCYFKKYDCCDTPFGGFAYEVNDFNDTVLKDVLRDILDMGQVTRFDLAIDDKGCTYYTCEEVCNIFRNGLYTSRFKKYRDDFEGGKGFCSGRTLYLGSRKSELFIRIYDKQLEQNSKKKDSVSFPWVRWEIELHRARANTVALLLAAGGALPDIALGILSNYLRFLVKDNARDSRCSTDPRWEAFLDGVKKIRICSPKVEKTIDDKRNWFRKQVAPTMAGIYEIDGDLSFIYECIDSGRMRLSKELLDMIEEEAKKYDR